MKFIADEALPYARRFWRMKKKKSIKNLTFQLVKSPKQYKRDGENVYLCAKRKMFVHATEEERVRQEFIAFLRDKVDMPLDMLFVEESMSHYKKGTKGRTDIIGLSLEENPLFVVECKKPEAPLTQDVFDQAETYADIAGCDIVILTNGRESEVLIRESKQWHSARGILTYKEMLQTGNYNYKKPNRKPWQRPEYKDIPRAIKDGAFGSWSGENQIISISITGTLSRKNDPKFGNRRGNTQLNVAIDDYEKKHHSLQLDMDKFVKKSGRQALIWHNGRMTVGNSGSVKQNLVLEYVRKKAPHLLEDNYISLAKLPTNRLITWRDAKPFLINCIEYALLRDEYRQIHTNTLSI